MASHDERRGAKSRPILVTGSHRSGTTWVGTMLSFAHDIHPIHEPMNPNYVRSWLRTPPTSWFTRIDADPSGMWRQQFDDVVALRPPLSSMLQRSPSPRNVVRVAEEGAHARWARHRGARALLKDPIALFAAPWLATTFDAEVVVLVRHPAAFASSLKRLNWRFDFRNLSEQPAIMNALSPAIAEHVETAARTPPDLIDTAIVLWCAINETVAQYGAEHPEWHIRRYEDLAADPLVQFQSLYATLGIQWTSACERAIRTHTSAAPAVDVATDDKGNVRRDSAFAMWTWTHRLTSDEIQRVRVGTADVAPNFYAPADWSPPHDSAE